MAILPPPSSFPSGTEGICYSTPYGITSNSIKLPIDGRRGCNLASTRCKSPFFGTAHFLWLSTGHDMCLSKVYVAADYSDSLPDSSSDMNEQGFHPLEELRGSDDIQPARLSPAEIAKTTVEANNNALLVFPGMVHCEPHDQISWAEFQYHIDDFGDIYFEILDDANILADRGANNPVNALIGMDIPIYDNNRRIASEYDIFHNGNNDEFDDDDDSEISEMEEYNIPVNWGLSDTTNSVHPIYFSKCLSKAVNDMECVKRMNHPSNAVSIIGYLRPAYSEEKSYLRMYHTEDDNAYISDWKDFYSDGINDQRDTSLTLYRLEILKIKLHSIYGYQSEINVPEFEDAEPDILAHSSAILERFNSFCDEALKALCKKKGLDAEEAYLVGVDSLGVDVRILSGVEVKTHRFAFKVQADTVNAAEKQIWQLLFPRSQRKKNMKKWRAQYELSIPR